MPSFLRKTFLLKYIQENLPIFYFHLTLGEKYQTYGNKKLCYESIIKEKHKSCMAEFSLPDRQKNHKLFAKNQQIIAGLDPELFFIHKKPYFFTTLR